MIHVRCPECKRRVLLSDCVENKDGIVCRACFDKKREPDINLETVKDKLQETGY